MFKSYVSSKGLCAEWEGSKLRRGEKRARAALTETRVTASAIKATLGQSNV